MNDEVHAQTRPDTSPGQWRGNNSEPDVVEVALAEALRGATAAGEWTTVAKLAAELQARREARANVVPLDAARRRRER